MLVGELENHGVSESERLPPMVEFLPPATQVKEDEDEEGQTA